MIFIEEMATVDIRPGNYLPILHLTIPRRPLDEPVCQLETIKKNEVMVKGVHMAVRNCAGAPC